LSIAVEGERERYDRKKRREKVKRKRLNLYLLPSCRAPTGLISRKLLSDRGLSSPEPSGVLRRRGSVRSFRRIRSYVLASKSGGRTVLDSRVGSDGRSEVSSETPNDVERPQVRRTSSESGEGGFGKIDASDSARLSSTSECQYVRNWLDKSETSVPLSLAVSTSISDEGIDGRSVLHRREEDLGPTVRRASSIRSLSRVEPL